MSNTKRVAFLGLGSMGRRMATRLIAAGVDVVVWSRSGAPLAVEALRGRSAPTSRAAATGADIVISMVTDDPASRAVWEHPEHGALSGVGPATLVIECSSLTPARIAELASRVKALGASMLDAPVVGSTPHAEAGSLTFLVGGAGDDVERARPLLLHMGGAVCHVGPSSAGAVMKLVVNALFGAQVAALAELLALTRHAGLPPALVLDTLAALPVLSIAAKGAAASMIAGKFDPQFPVTLAAKDLGYVVATASAAGGDLPVASRVLEVFEAARARGFGDENLTAVARLYP